MLNKIERARQNMPVLKKLVTLYKDNQPLKGLVIGACLHITKETAVLLLALRDCGADVIACGSNPLSTDDVVAQYLNSSGVKVYAKHGQTDEEYDVAIKKVAQIKTKKTK